MSSSELSEVDCDIECAGDSQSESESLEGGDNIVDDDEEQNLPSQG